MIFDAAKQVLYGPDHTLRLYFTGADSNGRLRSAPVIVLIVSGVTLVQAVPSGLDSHRNLYWFVLPPERVSPATGADAVFMQTVFSAGIVFTTGGSTLILTLFTLSLHIPDVTTR